MPPCFFYIKCTPYMSLLWLTLWVHPVCSTIAHSRPITPKFDEETIENLRKCDFVIFCRFPQGGRPCKNQKKCDFRCFYLFFLFFDSGFLLLTLSLDYVLKLCGTFTSPRGLSKKSSTCGKKALFVIFLYLRKTCKTEKVWYREKKRKIEISR